MGICTMIEQVIRLADKGLELQSYLGAYGRMRRNNTEDFGNRDKQKILRKVSGEMEASKQGRFVHVDRYSDKLVH